MPIKSRRERELERRHQSLLDIASRIFINDGYHSLTMDRLATEAEYSRTTVYQHFDSRDHVIEEIGLHSLQLYVELLEKASKFKGKTRERMWALVLAYENLARFYPESQHVEVMLRSSQITQRLSEDAQQKFHEYRLQIRNYYIAVIEEALALGELKRTDGNSPGHVYIGLWALISSYYGFIVSGYTIFEDLKIADPYGACHQLVDQCLDGCAWSSASARKDYDTVRTRIWKEVFPEQWVKIQYAILTREAI